MPTLRIAATPVHDIRVTAAIHLPGNWSAATALRANNSGAASLNGPDTTPAWAGWRLSQDYYHEGALLWPEADVKIRQLSQGTRSLDDFASQFFGASLSGTPFGKTGPGVEPYTSADLIKALNAIAPFDWNAFWRIRLNSLTPRPPTAGLEAAGYNYIDSERMVDDEATYMKAAHMAETFHSLGFLVMPDATLRDVWMGSPSFVAGLGPGDKLVTVNGKPYTPEVLTGAVREAKSNTRPIVLTASRDDESKTFEVQYHGGEKYAALERNKNPDLLTTAILQPK